MNRFEFVKVQKRNYVSPSTLGPLKFEMRAMARRTTVTSERMDMIDSACTRFPNVSLKIAKQKAKFFDKANAS